MKEEKKGKKKDQSKIVLNVSKAKCWLGEMLLGKMIVRRNVRQAKCYIGEPVQGESVQGEM